MHEDDYNQSQIDSSVLSISHITELVFQFQRSNGLLVDGKFGPLTCSALEEHLFLEERPEDGWEPFYAPAGFLPESREDFHRVWGDPGAGALDRDWYAKNIIELHQMHGNELPFVPPGRYIKCHRYAEPYLREALRRAQISCPAYKVERIGAFNYRHMRHNPAMPLSMHAFGIAVDIDPHKNRAVRFAKGMRPEPWSKQWKDVWPDGLPSEIVLAFESCSFQWGGRWERFCDPQHFELRNRATMKV